MRGGASYDMTGHACNLNPSPHTPARCCSFNIIGLMEFMLKYLPIVPFTCLLLIPIATLAQEGPVHLTGERLVYDIPSNMILIEGDVSMTRDGLRLDAGRIELDVTSGEGTAAGGVHIYLPQGEQVDTEETAFNIKSGLWRIDEADMWLEPSGHIHFMGAEKRDPNSFALTRLRFTTCQGKHPPWVIHGTRGELKPGRSVKIRHLSLWIKRIPVFYLPIASIPIKETGSTGMESPEAGHSSRHGYFLKNHFTWPLARHTEGRLFFDVFTRTGIGLGTGWQHSPATDGRGSTATFYLLREDSPERIHGSGDLFLDTGKRDNTRGVIDVHYPSDRDYYHRFSFDSSLRDLRIGESRAFVTTQQSGFNYVAAWEHLRSLHDLPKSDIHQAPRLSLHHRYTPVPLTLPSMAPLWGLNLSGVHLEWDVPEGDDHAEHYSIEPRVCIQGPGNPWFTMSSCLSSRQTLYDSPRDKEEWSHDHAASFTLTGPRIFHDYIGDITEADGNRKGFRHLVYPQVVYEYETHEGSPPFAMQLEPWPEETENVHFMLVNRIGGRSGNGSAPPLLDLVISHTLKLKKKSQLLGITAGAAPNSILRFNGRGYFVTEGGDEKDIDAACILGSAEKGEISVGWRHLVNHQLGDGLNTARLFLASPLWRGYQITASCIRDFKTKSRVEEAYSLLYHHTCLRGSISYINRVDEDLIRASLHLVF